MSKLFLDWYEKPELPHQFSVDSREPRDTGLLDPDGNKIFASPEPIGFVTDFKPVKPRIRVKAGRQPI